MEKLVLHNSGGNLYPETKGRFVDTGGLPLNQRLSNDYFLLRDQGNGKFKKVSLRNGVFEFEDFEFSFGGYSHVLCCGNSITIGRTETDPYNIWWGSWGMAASAHDKDYVAVLQSKLREVNPLCKCYHIGIYNTFERDQHSDLTYIIDNNISNFDNFTSDMLPLVDLVILRVGENSLASQQLVEDFITSVQNTCPDAEIVVTGMYWANATKEGYLRGAAKTKGVTFVSLAGIDSSETRWGSGAQVYGDDGELHTITHGGVANHPNDLGMSMIADRIYSSLSKVNVG